MNNLWNVFGNYVTDLPPIPPAERPVVDMVPEDPVFADMLTEEFINNEHVDADDDNVDCDDDDEDEEDEEDEEENVMDNIEELSNIRP